MRSQYKPKTNEALKTSVLKSPRLIEREYVLPTKSALHYVAFRPQSAGPSSNDGFINTNIKDNMVAVVPERISSNISLPKYKRTPTREINAWIKKLEGVRLYKNKDLSNIPDSTLILFNYYPVARAYTYTKPSTSTIHELTNLYKTVLDQMVSNIEETDRQQYLHIDIPLEVYSLDTYRKYSSYNDVKLNTVYARDPDQYVVMELHAWMTNEISIFDMVDPDKLININLLVGTSSRNIIVNLGLMYSLRVNDDSVLKEHNMISSLGSTKLTPTAKESLIPKFFSSLREQLTVKSLKTVNEDQYSESQVVVKDVVKAPEIVAEELKDVDIDTAIEEENMSPTESVKARLKTMLANDDISGSKYKSMIKKLEKAATVPHPLIEGAKMDEHINVSPSDAAIDPNETKLVDHPDVFDKQMLGDSLSTFDSKYIKDIMPKHYGNVVSSLKRAGIIIEDYKVEKKYDVLGEYEIHVIKLTPVDGNSSTLRIKMPLIGKDGLYTTNNNSNRLRKQKVEIPIRKVAAYKVIISSYYGRLFVTRSQLAIDDVVRWVDKQIFKQSTSKGSTVSVLNRDVADKEFKAPTMYTRLGSKIESVISGTVNITFNHTIRNTYLKKKDSLEEIEGKDYVLLGTSRSGYLVMGSDNNVYTYSKGEYKLTGSIFTLLNMDESKAPKDLAVINISGKNIPLVMYFTHHYGFKGTLKILGGKVKVYTAGKKVVDVKPSDVVIKLEDYTLHLTDLDHKSRMVMQGYVKYAKVLKNIEYKDFITKDIATYLLDTQGYGVRFIYEFDNLKNLFVDPITEDYLKQIKEPHVFRDLLLKAVEYLTNEEYPDEIDGKYMRVRGYERLPGFMYEQLTKSIRNYKIQINKKRQALEMSPYEVWKIITSDSSNKLQEETNPIMFLKEQDVVTYTGRGGRTKETMNKPTRKYHANDMGIISEATVDSTDVGITEYMSANPQMTDVYGTNGSKIKNAKDNTAAAYSTVFNLMPGLGSDDPKRVNFASIQSSHIRPIEGAESPYVRSGYETLLAQRVSDMYASTAKIACKVVKVKKAFIQVKNKDGTLRTVKLGTVEGSAEGSFYPHEIVTDRKAGDKIKVGEYIAYNKGFFEPDAMNPKILIYKAFAYANCALVEGLMTNEDAMGCSPNYTDKLVTKVLYPHRYTLNFDQHVSDIPRINSKIFSGDVMFYIEDNITNASGVFDESTLNSIKDIVANVPKSEYDGVIESISVRYNGDKEDMSPSLKALADKSDRELRKLRKAQGKPLVTGSVGTDYRVNGKPLLPDSLEITIFVKSEVPAWTGDKFIVSYQLKATISKIFSHPVYTEEGDEVDLTFGGKSVAARIVNSFNEVGMLNTYLHHIPKHLMKLYKK